MKSALDDIVSNTQLEHQQISSQSKIFPISLLADDIEIAGNVGSLFRLSEAFGIEKIYLTGTTVVPPKYKIRKAARATDKKIPHEYSTSAIEVVNHLKSKNYKIISIEITTRSQDLRSFNMPNRQPICIILGSENKGIKQSLLDASDHTLHIPMYGENSSMNVANSCAIALYQLVQFYAT
ncbi:MAG: TrmH family RNA methyltransferase [Cocleimonas sp.]